MACDPFQMAMIHRTFRHQFRDLSGVIRSLSPGDIHRSKFVGNYLSNMISVLHHHHAAEDELLWPKLQVRVPGSDDTLQRAQAEHAVIAQVIDQVGSIGPRWARCAEGHLAGQLSSALAELSARVSEHFEYEERSVIPLIAQHITAQEWQGFIDRGAAYVGPKNLWFSLAYSGFLLGDATPDEQRRFLASVPVALRIVVRLLGGRAYAGYRDKLYGDACDAISSVDDDPSPVGP